MKVVGMVVEYNPFHNGHLYHLNQSKKITGSDYSIAIMSGHFLQRGEPALFDKWSRAKMAVENGVDLVIELPTLYSCQSAEFFANGAVKILDKLNVVDYLSFGSESGNIEVLKLIGQILNNEPESYKKTLKRELSSGILFPKARSKALYEYIHESNFEDVDLEEIEELLSNPNNILGIEYIKNILKYESDIKPVTLQRHQAGYNSTEFYEDICSATAIRESLKSDDDIEKIRNYVPEKTYEIMKERLDQGFKPVFVENFYQNLVYRTLLSGKKLENIFEVKEGIENKIMSNIMKHNNYQEFLHSVKSKRYTLTSIKRMLNNIVLDLEKDIVVRSKEDYDNVFMRILAFNDKGRKIISKIKKSSDIEILNKLGGKKELNYILNEDIKATDIYNTVYYMKQGKAAKGSMDFYNSPVYIG